MSHFTVLVVTPTGDIEDVENALQPYHEYECTGYEDEYVETIDMTDELLEEYDDPDATEPALMKGDEVICHKFDRKALQYYKKVEKTNPFDSDHKYEPMEGYRIEQVHPKAIYPTLAEYAEFHHGYNSDEIVDGRIYRKTNPNAKWDWWQIGGRWSGHFRLKDGSRVDQAKKSDIDFDTEFAEKREVYAKKYDDAQAVIAGRTWTAWKDMCMDDIDKARKDYHDQQVVKDLEKFDDSFFANLDEYQMDREDYIKGHLTSHVGTFAVIKDDEWREKANMGWWAMTSNENDNWSDEFMQILESIPDDHYLTLVDCHI